MNGEVPSLQSLVVLVEKARECFSAINNKDLLEQEKARFLGKSGALGPWMETLKNSGGDERRRLGQALNAAKDAITNALTERRQFLHHQQVQAQLQAEHLDVSLPGWGMGKGGLHPVTLTVERLTEIFHSMGFESVEGPEIETDDLNFTQLNTPADHPARSMHDTFYLQGMPGMLLRTHTSPVQMRRMGLHREKHPGNPAPDLRIIAPGRCYRVDSDATHSPMFHQVEGLWIGERVSFADLKGVMVNFLQAFFDSSDLQFRFRPSYFPFTEPSAEVDLSFHRGEESRWLEVAGCGMVHPQVLKNGGFDPCCYSGFAFGCGLERLTMLRYGVEDLRLFYTGDLRVLGQFH